MNAIVDFIVDNIFIIITACLFLIFTLVGYYVDSKNNREKKEKKILNKVEENLELAPFEFADDKDKKVEEKIKEEVKPDKNGDINLEELNK